MHRIEGEDFINVGGKNLFQDGPPGTRVEDDWLNAVQEEIANVIESAGLTLKTAATDTRDQLIKSIPILANKYAIISDEENSGVSATGILDTSWRTRTLNTISTNISGVSLGSNQITLPAGTYKVVSNSIAQPFSGIAIVHKAKLYNVTDAADELIGTSGAKQSSSDRNVISGVFTITSTKVFELRQRSDKISAFNNLGFAASFGVNEVYAQIEIIKIAD